MNPITLTPADIQQLFSRQELNMYEAACLIANCYPTDPASQDDPKVAMAMKTLNFEFVKGTLSFTCDLTSAALWMNGTLKGEPAEAQNLSINTESFLTWIKIQSWCPDHLMLKKSMSYDGLLVIIGWMIKYLKNSQSLNTQDAISSKLEQDIHDTGFRKRDIDGIFAQANKLTSKTA